MWNVCTVLLGQINMLFCCRIYSFLDSAPFRTWLLYFLISDISLPFYLDDHQGHHLTSIYFYGRVTARPGNWIVKNCWNNCLLYSSCYIVLLDVGYFFWNFYYSSKQCAHKVLSITHLLMRILYLSFSMLNVCLKIRCAFDFTA